MIPLTQSSTRFLEYLDTWTASLTTISLKEALPDPKKAAILSVDITNGFCKSGALASPRVAGIIQPITQLFSAAWDHGLRESLLIQDSHESDAVEFSAFPPHCIRGSVEAQPVDEFKALPFFEQMQILPKNSISSSLNTGLPAWLEQRPEIDTFIVVGDCTDLCTYQLAMHLRLGAYAGQFKRRVIVPLNCIETYDLPVDAAAGVGALPHPGDLMHIVFAYHMELNGVEVVKQIA